VKELFSTAPPPKSQVNSRHMAATVMFGARTTKHLLRIQFRTAPQQRVCHRAKLPQRQSRARRLQSA
jgi:hypothetical protein